MVDDFEPGPYQPPIEHVAIVDVEKIRQKLQVPAIILMVFAGISLALQSANLFMPVANLDEILNMPEFRDIINQNPELGEMFAMMASGWVKVVSTLFQLVLSGLIFIGAFKMYRLESWGLAVTAALLTAIPCFGPCCCLLDIPLGIWSLMLLFDEDTKLAFQNLSEL